MTDQLKELIKTKRSNLTEGSIKTYISMLTNLYKKINNNKEFDHKFFISNPNEVINHLKDKEPKNRKTILSALVVLCDGSSSCDKYRKLMLSDAEKANKEAETQIKTDKQNDNWVSFENVKAIHNNLRKEVNPLWNKEKLSTDELQRIQNYVILSLYTMIPPRRLLDYTEMKIKKIDEEKDNYLEKNKLVFNRYKTAKFYGKQEVEIPLKLKLLLNRWIKLNPTDYLLFDVKGDKLTPSKLTQRLNKIFNNKSISASMLRHIYISDEILKDVPALEKLKKIAGDMAHDISTQMLYKKN